MKKIAFLFIIAATLWSCKNNTNEANTSEAQEEATAAPTADTYMVDVANSKIDWVGSKPLENHTGTINIAEGQVLVTDGAVTAGKFSIDMNSITVTDLEGDSKVSLESHLKGTAKEEQVDHFFNVTKYPTATFAITSIENVEGKTMVNGNLTIKETTQNISFPATLTMNGEVMTLTSETFSIDRTKWGVNYGSKTIFGDLGDKFINDNIDLTVALVAKKA